MDNILRNDIGGRRFCAENKGHRTGGLFACFDFQIFMDDIQRIHLLTFVFMQSLGLNIKNGIRIQRNAFHFLYISRQVFFAVHFDFGDTVKRLFIVFVFQQFFQFIRILFEAVSNRIGQEGRQFPVTGKQPSSERDAVRLIVEFFGIQPVKRVQLRVFQNIRMDCGHAVDRKAVMNVDMSHMDSLVLVDNLYFRVFVFCRNSFVQLFDNRH